MDEPPLPPESGNPRGTKAYKDAARAIKDAGGRMVTAPMKATARNIQQAVREELPAQYLLDAPGPVEWSGYWTDPGTGIRVKIRLDKYCPDLDSGPTAVQLKTCADIPRFLRDFERLGYYFREAFYAMVLEGLGVPVANHCIVAAETGGVHDVLVYRVEEEALDAGRGEVRAALDLLARCRDSGHWPGRSGGMVHSLNLPSWRLARLHDASQVEYLLADDEDEGLEVAA
jgi:hypothetical protein